MTMINHDEAAFNEFFMEKINKFNQKKIPIKGANKAYETDSV